LARRSCRTLGPMPRAPIRHLTGIALLIPALAAANMGVPLVAVFLPPLWLALVPIVLLEASVVARMLGGRLQNSLVPVGVANVLSTVLGIPLMWVVLAVAQLIFAGDATGLSTPGLKIYAVTVQAPWLIPYEDELKWMVPSALVVMAIPAFCLSVLVEWQVIARFKEFQGRSRVLRAVAVSNLLSYALLAVFFVVLAYVPTKSQDMSHSAFRGVVNWLVELVFGVAQTVAGGK
jgi:hypothetical protein